MSFLFAPTTTQIYTLSLHDALPICDDHCRLRGHLHRRRPGPDLLDPGPLGTREGDGHAQCLMQKVRIIDRKSTRLNSSHEWISYAVFCLKKKRKGGRRWRSW